MSIMLLLEIPDLHHVALTKTLLDTIISVLQVKNLTARILGNWRNKTQTRSNLSQSEKLYTTLSNHVLKMFSIDVGEREEGRETQRETHQPAASHRRPHRDPTRSLGVCARAQDRTQHLSVHRTELPISRATPAGQGPDNFITSYVGVPGEGEGEKNKMPPIPPPCEPFRDHYD